MGVAVEFVWLGGVGLVGVVIFISKPTTVLRLCCVVVEVVTIYICTTCYKYTISISIYCILCATIN